MKFFLGCAVWGYKGWLGELFPTGSRATDFLHLYSQRLTTVEGNTTFYSVPDVGTVARWAAETPLGFKFCPKLPKAITHQGLLQPNIPAALNFLRLMQGLNQGASSPQEVRLGPIFAQLPPSYGPKQFPDLIAFLRAWPRQTAPLALEVRHPDWFQEPYSSQLVSALQELQVGRVLLDTRPVYQRDDDPQVLSERRKPQLPLQISVTASFVLVRFISHPQQELNQCFLTEWVEQIQQWSQQNLQIYFFVHCPIEARSPRTARYFQSLLEQRNISVPALPWNLIDPTVSTQLSLL
jgi:uncharacterized protein YecE (DUF72 family)